jgi:hypothetical protein
MGAWGNGFFQNDVGDGVKYYYVNKLKAGKTDEEAFSEVVKLYKDMLENPDDAIDFWLALSLIMHKYGRLTDFVKGKALSIIKSGADIERWKENKTELKQRTKEIEKLKEILTGIMPERKKVKIYKKIIAPFDPNEVYTIKLTDDYFKNSVMYNKFLIFIVKSLIEESLEVEDILNIYPKVYIKLFDTEPKTIDDIENAVFIPRVICMQEDPTYEYALVADSNSQFNKFKNTLSYLGKFEDYNRPIGENENQEFAKILMPLIKALYRYIKRNYHSYVLGEKNLPIDF